MNPKPITIRLDPAGLEAYRELELTNNMGPLISVLLEREAKCQRRYRRPPRKPAQYSMTVQ